MQENNARFIEDTLTRLEHGDFFNQQVRAGMKEGLPVIPLDTREITADRMNGKTVEFDPKVVMTDKTKEWYDITGVQATLKQPGKEPVTNNFKIKTGRGRTAKQMYNLLDGRSVKWSFKRQTDEKPTILYSKLDFSRAKDEEGTYPNKSVNAADIDYNLVRILSRANLVSMDQPLIESMINRMDNGERVAAIVKQTGGGTREVYLHGLPHEGAVAVTDERGLAIKNAKGEDMKIYASPQYAERRITKTPESVGGQDLGFGNTQGADRAREIALAAEQAKNGKGKGKTAGVGV